MLKQVKRYTRTALENAIVHPIVNQIDRLGQKDDELIRLGNRIGEQLGLLPLDDGLSTSFARLVPGKRELIDFICQMMPVASFADLGGAWSDPPGAYSFYAMERYKIPAGFLVDGCDLEGLAAGVEQHAGLTFINRDFASREVAEQIGDVDVVFLFDVLYMQSRPNWEEVLDMYAGRTKCFLVSNVQFNNFTSTVRLMDLGEDEYFNNVPSQCRDDPSFKELFRKLDEIHPVFQCCWRDCHHFWQWGMTDRDLIEKMRSLGFRMHYYRTMFKRTDIKNDAESRAFAFIKEPIRIPIG